ncbi:terpene synthase family protein [Streptomyces sp. NRRL B-24484]|uniref:terpene synthase family protein n=1 Tax=Streptomyces sp. NRRL B-24484 TaxID=1463833 RepID=UPI0004BEC164|nr:terpene cyclase [Streptomyces sp. NRRL B-24484]
MPQDTEFHLPFPPAVSPDLTAARRRNLSWVRRHRLVGEGRALDWYASWDVPRLAAYGFPYAQGPALDLCADAMAFFFVFDDQFDGPLGSLPDRVAAVCRRLIDVVHGVAPRTGADPCTTAFADLWRRSVHGAPPGWTARVAHEWEYYFAAHPHEALDRLRGTPSGMESFLQVRRGVAATALPVSLGERAAGIRVPAVAFHAPQLRRMRDIAVDVPIMCNDVCSLEKEEARGDIDNLVLVLEHERGLSRDGALAAANSAVARRVEDFRHLAGEVPGMCCRLGLDGPQRASVDTYVRVMSAWIGGYRAWQTETTRYRTALDVLPRSGPGHFDDLFGP